MPAVDIDVLYAYLKPGDWLKEASVNAITKIEVGEIRGYTSVIAVVELEIVSRRDYDMKFANNVLKELKKIRNLRLIDVDEAVLIKAVTLREEYDMNIFDSIHGAVALLNDMEIISTDYVFENIEGLEVIDPRDLESSNSENWKL